MLDEDKVIQVIHAEDEEPSVLVNGKAYKEDTKLNDFIEENGLNLNIDELQYDIVKSVKLQKLSINESVINIEISNFTKLIDLDKIVPDTMQSSLILKDMNNDKNNIILANFIFKSDDLLSAKTNLNFVEKNNHPLEPGNYVMYIQIQWITRQRVEKTRVKIPLGYEAVENFTIGLKETELYFYAAKRQIKSKVIYTYDEQYNSLKIVVEKMADFNPSKAYGDLKNKTANPGKIYKGFQKFIYPLVYDFMKILPVKKNRIFLASDSRDEMGGNFEFLNAELNKQNFNDIHYIFNENQFVKKSLRTFIKFAWLTATSEYIFIEESHPMLEKVNIKPNVNVIQTWHAAGAFKTFGYTSMRLMSQDTTKLRFHRYYTNATVSSKAMVPIYADAFDVDADIIKPLGLARSDLFWNSNLMEERIKGLREKYDFLNTNKKIILFAPTFRGAGRKQAHYPYEYLNLENIYESLKDEYIFLFKVHFNTLNKINIPVRYSDFFYDVSDYRDINDLMLLADIMISDYSSVTFEFSLLNKPMLFFVPDLEDYISTRGFYYHYDDLVPGKIVYTSAEMIRAIKRRDFEQEKISKFKDQFFTYQDGKASKRIVDYFINGIDENGENVGGD